MVHRWATAHWTGADRDEVPTQTKLRETAEDLSGFYDDGVRVLLVALERHRATPRRSPS